MDVSFRTRTKESVGSRPASDEVGRAAAGCQPDRLATVEKQAVSSARSR